MTAAQMAVLRRELWGWCPLRFTCGLRSICLIRGCDFLAGKAAGLVKKLEEATPHD